MDLNVAGLVALITVGTNSLIAIAGVFVSLRNSEKITEVHESTNGKMDAFIKEVRESSFNKGVVNEKEHNEVREASFNKGVMSEKEHNEHT